MICELLNFLQSNHDVPCSTNRKLRRRPHHVLMEKKGLHCDRTEIVTPLTGINLYFTGTLILLEHSFTAFGCFCVLYVNKRSFEMEHHLRKPIFATQYQCRNLVACHILQNTEMPQTRGPINKKERRVNPSFGCPQYIRFA